MNHSRLTFAIAPLLVFSLIVGSVLVGCNSQSKEADVAPSIGERLSELSTSMAKSRGIPESEYTPHLFLRGCGDQAIENVQPYLGVLADAPIQLIMTDDCFPEAEHSLYLKDKLTKGEMAIQGSGSPQFIERYFINGQTTLYVGKDGMIAYIHTSDQPFEFKTWEELIAHIESHSN